MYQFSGKLKTFSIALMIIGALGVGYSFLTAPKTVEEAKEIIASQHDSHETTAATHAPATDSHEKKDSHATAKTSEHAMMSMQNTYCMHCKTRPWAALM